MHAGTWCAFEILRNTIRLVRLRELLCVLFALHESARILHSIHGTQRNTEPFLQ